MAMISNLICEYSLPLPSSVTGDTDGDFEEIKWDEYNFYTSSFFDIGDGFFTPSSYTITEDGQFYKESFTIDLENGEEKSKGIEKQDFTGEIHFGTEILGKNNDHSIDFRAILYKGELKELDLEQHEKRDNEGRKEAVTEMFELQKEEIARRKSLSYLLAYPFKRVISFIVSLMRWVLVRVFVLLVKIETWGRE